MIEVSDRELRAANRRRRKKRLLPILRIYSQALHHLVPVEPQRDHEAGQSLEVNFSFAFPAVLGVLSQAKAKARGVSYRRRKSASGPVVVL